MHLYYKQMSKILQTENPKIVSFYEQHPSINFEKANLLLIEFLDSMFNHISTDPDANINSQILSYILWQRIKSAHNTTPGTEKVTLYSKINGVM